MARLSGTKRREKQAEVRQAGPSSFADDRRCF